MNLLQQIKDSLSRNIGSFDHGVHPSHHKGQTEKLAIQRLPFGKRFVIPLGQHIGAPAKPIVQAGDTVKTWSDDRRARWLCLSSAAQSRYWACHS